MRAKVTAICIALVLLGRVFYRGLDLGDQMMRLGMVTSFDAKDEGKIPPTGKLFGGQPWS